MIEWAHTLRTMLAVKFAVSVDLKVRAAARRLNPAPRSCDFEAELAAIDDAAESSGKAM